MTRERAEYDREGGQVTVDAAERHVRKHFPADWFAVKVADETVVVHGTESVTTYTLDDATDNPRVLATSDAVLYEGSVHLTDYEDGVVNLCHRQAGVKARIPVDVFLDEKVPTLERTELVGIQGVTEVDSDA
jgi:hypothetical protein